MERRDDGPPQPILAINSGSSSLKFALFDGGPDLRRLMHGTMDVGGGSDSRAGSARPVSAPDSASAVRTVMEAIEGELGGGRLVGVGHRIVHGGPDFSAPCLIDPAVVAALGRMSAFDPEHLPKALALVEAMRAFGSETPQVACFDTAFHHDLPRVARLLPIPRRYEALGVRRYGFHGLSCTFLMRELARLDGVRAAAGRVVLAHLGSGASLTAVHGGKSIDTTMSFTPTSGMPMSSRAGDLDPGLMAYLARTEQMTPDQFAEMVNFQAGLMGMSETSGDMADLLRREGQDVRAAEAVAVFCYQARKWIGAYAAALGGLDALVFAGGVGENAPVVRARICDGLGFLGVELDEARNAAGDSVISTAHARVKVRVIHTDEEVVIARSVAQLLGAGAQA